MFISAVRCSGILCLLTAFVPLSAQVGRSGSITGEAFGPDHTPIAGATLTPSALDGLTRTSLTALDGSFSFPDLPSGSYTIQGAAQSFAPLTLTAVPVAIGRTASITLPFVLASTTESVSVTATPQALDTAQTSSVVNIDRDRVEELPIPSRNYLSFVALSPQAAPANPAYAASTLSQSSGGFGFGGLRPSSNAIRIDGVGDDDEYAGTSRTQLSPEAISDFQIVNHGFAAESGGAAGGAIDVQTRAGLNRVHGDAFLFVQNGALNGTPPLEFTPYKPDENRIRAGLALGGPLERNRTFYYVAAEQEMAHGQDTNDLRPATLSQINAVLAQPGPLRGLALQGGFLPTSDQETEISGRIDRTLTAKHAAMLRYAFTNTRNVNDAFNTDDLSDQTARGSSFFADNSLNGTLTSAFTPALLHKFNFELAQRRAFERTGSSATPGVLIPGIAQFGTPYAGNIRRFETHLEFSDTLLYQWRKHLLPAGATLDDVHLRSQVLDGQRGLFVFPTLTGFAAGAADFYTRSVLTNPNLNFREERISGYVQDHWTPARSFTLDYGVRYDFNHLPAALPQHPFNLSPRLGVAWNPFRSLVVRSGFGIFYDRFLLSTLNKLLELDGQHGFTQVVEDSAAAALFRTGAPATLSVLPGIWSAQPTLHNPYSEVASFSVEQALPLQTTLKGEYQLVHAVHLGRTTNINLPPPVVLTGMNAAALGVSLPNQQQIGRLAFPPSRLNPAYDNINQFATSAGSSYSGGTVTLNRQFTDDIQILAGYSFSKTFDDASYDTEQPQNPYALGDERALSLQDQRHRLTLSGLWLIGPDLNDLQDAAANANPGPLMRALTGLEFAPILSVHSGFRANPLTGLDSNREHVYPFAARPSGLARNSLEAPAILDLDLRVLKMVPVHGGHLDIVAESFNLLNHRNITLLNSSFGSGAVPQVAFARRQRRVVSSFLSITSSNPDPTQERRTVMQIQTRVSMYRRQAVSVVLGAALISGPFLLAQSSQSADGNSLPDAPSAETTVSSKRNLSAEESPTLLGTPRRIIVDEVRIVTSPARLRTHDLIWLLPVAGATAASLATDTRVMRDVVSHDPGFNSSANTSSDVLRGAFIGGPVVLYGVGQFIGNAKAREAGLLAGEAMVDGYITSEGIKYITLRERPNIQNARGHFFQTDSVFDPSFVSGHSIVAWSSAAVLAGEYSEPWQQIGIYTLATGASLTRVLGQDHFPTDVLIGSVSGWLIGRYVYRAHHAGNR